jgi:ornithine carbamoyltransferase
MNPMRKAHFICGDDDADEPQKSKPAFVRRFFSDEIRFLLRLTKELKAAKLASTERQRLLGKNIALIFEKDSTRTRSGFEVAAYDQGAHVTYLGPSGSHMGHKESVKDTARVLGRMYDGIEFRGFSHQDARDLVTS